MSSSATSLFRVSFVSKGEVYEVFAKQVYQADMYGFVVIEELVFGERTAVVIDPAEERLKDEFSGVKRSYVPMHAVLRIDEVEKRGTATVTDLGDKVAAFPHPVYTRGGDDKR